VEDEDKQKMAHILKRLHDTSQDSEDLEEDLAERVQDLDLGIVGHFT
jgi:hypothetical protein